MLKLSGKLTKMKGAKSGDAAGKKKFMLAYIGEWPIIYWKKSLLWIKDDHEMLKIYFGLRTGRVADKERMEKEMWRFKRLYLKGCAKKPKDIVPVHVSVDILKSGQEIRRSAWVDAIRFNRISIDWQALADYKALGQYLYGVQRKHSRAWLKRLNRGIKGRKYEIGQAVFDLWSKKWIVIA